MHNILYHFFSIVSWIAFGAVVYTFINSVFDSWNRDYYSFLSDLLVAVYYFCEFMTDTLDSKSIAWRVLDAAIVIWWGYTAWKNRNNRKKRKNLLQRLGEKSKQKIQEMVDKLVESPIPSPV